MAQGVCCKNKIHFVCLVNLLDLANAARAISLLCLACLPSGGKKKHVLLWVRSKYLNWDQRAELQSFGHICVVYVNAKGNCIKYYKLWTIYVCWCHFWSPSLHLGKLDFTTILKAPKEMLLSTARPCRYLFKQLNFVHSIDGRRVKQTGSNRFHHSF